MFIVALASLVQGISIKLSPLKWPRRAAIPHGAFGAYSHICSSAILMVIGIVGIIRKKQMLRDYFHCCGKNRCRKRVSFEFGVLILLAYKIFATLLSWTIWDSLGHEMFSLQFWIVVTDILQTIVLWIVLVASLLLAWVERNRQTPSTEFAGYAKGGYSNHNGDY